jgi:hypothetical protein
MRQLAEWARLPAGSDLAELLAQHTELEGRLQDLELDDEVIPDLLADYLATGQRDRLAPLLAGYRAQVVGRTTLQLHVLLTRIALHRALRACPERVRDPELGRFAEVTDEQLERELDQLETMVRDWCRGGRRDPGPTVWSW